VAIGVAAGDAGDVVPAAKAEADAAAWRFENAHQIDGSKTRSQRVKLVLTRSALSDRQAMREYIATDNINAAIDVDLLLSEKATALASHPRLGRTERAAGTLELVAHQNYVLIYDVAGGIVRVLRVFARRANVAA